MAVEFKFITKYLMQSSRRHKEHKKNSKKFSLFSFKILGLNSVTHLQSPA